MSDDPTGARPPRVLALDRGEVRVGVAISDELGLLAHPRPALDGRRAREMFETLRALCAEEGVERVLVGYPLDLQGEEGAAARRAVRFAEEVARVTGLTVELVDERMTTVIAARSLREAGVSKRAAKQKVDGAAAAHLLQGWLDARRRR